VAARAALTAAQAALTAADTAYRTSNKGVLDIWEAAVPDSAWRHLYDLEEAKRLLNLVKNADPAVDDTAVTTAETALATALDKIGASADVLRVLEGERQRRAARLEFEDGAAPRLLFSALRGDL
jgi:hypothetical protein